MGTSLFDISGLLDANMQRPGELRYTGAKERAPTGVCRAGT